MGLCSSGDFLCSITQAIFKEARNVTLVQSIDDFLLCAVDMADLECQMREVIRVAAKYGVVFNMEKVEVGSLAVFVGMLIRCQDEGPPLISPDPKNVEALKAIPIPQTHKELRQFLGLANAIAKLTTEHQRWAQPLYSLINSFLGPKSWTEKHMAAFEAVKQYLGNPKNVVYPFKTSLPVSLFVGCKPGLQSGI